MPNLIGHSLGRYHILEQLGEGGMATVYKAYDTRLERDVAIKVIRSDAFPPNQLERILKRFEREAKALAKLSHLHIIKVIDYGEHAGSPYLVMEYMPGGTLKQRLGKPMPWQETLRILLPVTEALEYAHAHNIIHRDIKPANILLTEKDQPMLTDFGIAKILESDETATLTGTGIGVGTPEYMAPEQWTGQSTTQSDIYSLGIVFYEMVTGRKPYTADTPAAILLKQANEPLPRPGKFAALPQTVENVLLKALAKNPKDRYQNMADLAQALEGLATGKVPDKKYIPPKTNVLPARPPARHSEFKLPAFPRRTVTTLGLIALGIGLFAFFLPLLKSIPTTFSPTATPSNTPMPSDTPTSTITTTPQATHTPSASPTPTLGIVSTWTRPADGMEMVYVPEGEFTMGSDDGYDDEKPVHQVFLDAFWIDRTEVTNAMYAKCVQAGICKNPASSVQSSKYDQHPVQFVEWNDAQSYCSWAEVRLPTEAEWEKAARGTDGRTYPWGEGIDCDKANIRSCVYNTSIVGGYESGKSPYGVHDMAGNVWEWVNDWYAESYYQDSPSSNPQGPANGNYRVLRGGSWGVIDNLVRSACRSRNDPTGSNYHVGFRCARSTSP